jgi:ribonuclease Z
MAKIIILGTATNIPDENHEHTHLAIAGEKEIVLIDGPGTPFARLLRARLDPMDVSAIVMTHFHPDHIGGLPALLMSMSLAGREKGLKIFANEHCLTRFQRMMADFDVGKLVDFPLDYHQIADEEKTLVYENIDVRVYSSPVRHYVPAIGLRMEFSLSGQVVVYSGDTAPTPALDALAKGCGVLIHEAGGESEGHSSATQAGEAAARCSASRLFLVHYPVGELDSRLLEAEAGRVFSGTVKLARDFEEIWC